MDFSDLYWLSLCDGGVHFYSLSWLCEATFIGLFGIGPIVRFDVVFIELHTFWETMGFEMHKTTIGDG